MNKDLIMSIIHWIVKEIMTFYDSSGVSRCYCGGTSGPWRIEIISGGINQTRPDGCLGKL